MSGNLIMPNKLFHKMRNYKNYKIWRTVFQFDLDISSYFLTICNRVKESHWNMLSEESFAIFKSRLWKVTMMSGMLHRKHHVR